MLFYLQMFKLCSGKQLTDFYIDHDILLYYNVEYYDLITVDIGYVYWIKANVIVFSRTIKFWTYI